MTSLPNRTEIEMAGKPEPLTSEAYRQMMSKQLRESLTTYKGVLGEDGKESLMGKHYRDFTSSDFSRVTDLTTVVSFPLMAFSIGDYSIIDEIKPKDMSRDQYFSVLLRNGRRLGLLEAVLNNSYLLNPTEANTPVRATRPVDAEPGQGKTATLAAGDVVFRDLATDLLQHKNAKSATYGMDVAKQIGVIGKLEASDEVALMLGYAAASNPQLSANGALPLKVNFKDATYEAQPAAFCASMVAIAKPGRPAGLDQNIATSTGVLLAREHAKTAFADTGKEIRLHNQTCASTPLPWNAATMSKQLTGTEVGRKAEVATR